MDTPEPGRHGANPLGPGLPGEPAGPQDRQHGHQADGDADDCGAEAIRERAVGDEIVEQADQGSDKRADSDGDQPGLPAGQFERGESVDQESAGQAEPDDASPHQEIGVFHALEGEAGHQP